MIHHVEQVTNKISTIMITFDAGARSEAPGGFNPGIAHMLEHSIFKGTKKRNWEVLQREIAFIGGDSNAYTSNEMVVYFIEVPHEKLEHAVEIISDMVFNSEFPEEEFLKEREVVLEEERSRADQINTWLWTRFDEVFFEGHTLATPVIGTQESIKRFTNQEVKDFYKTYCQPENMLVTLVSPMAKDDALKMLNTYFGTPDGQFNFTAPNQNFVHHPSRTIELGKADLQQSYLWLGFPGLKVDDEDRFAETVMTSIFGSGMDSRLFTEVREKRGLCYGIRSFNYGLRDTGAYLITSSTQGTNIPEMLEVVRQEIGKICSEPITEEELQRAKNKIRSESYHVMEGSHSIASCRMEEEFYKTVPLETFIQRVEQVTPEQVRAVAKKIFDDTKCLTMVCRSSGNETEQVEHVEIM